MAYAAFSFENVMEPGIVMSGSAGMTSTELPGPADWPADLANEIAIQRDQQLYIMFNWSKSGPAPLDPNLKWRILINTELQGAGEYQLPATYHERWENYGTVGFNASWSHSVTIPAYTLPVGLLRITASIQLAGPGPVGTGQRQGIIGISNLGLFQVYED